MYTTLRLVQYGCINLESAKVQKAARNLKGWVGERGLDSDVLYNLVTGHITCPGNIYPLEHVIY